MTTQEAKSRLNELAERFSRCAERVRLDDPIASEQALLEDAGEVLEAMLRSGVIPDPKGLLRFFGESASERHRIEKVPHHRRMHPDVWDPVSPYRLLFTRYADTVLSLEVPMPATGLSSVDGRGLGANQFAAMMRARLLAEARCCRAIARRVHEAEDLAGEASKPNAASVSLGANSKGHDVKCKLPETKAERGTPSTSRTLWKNIQNQLLGKRERGEPYTSLRKLEAELGCQSDAPIRRAIENSDLLKKRQARSIGPKAAPKASGLSAVATDNTPQATEPAPDDFLPDDDVDAIMNKLINQAKPDERAELNALDDARRRKLAATYQAQCRDHEPSPLEPDKPGERPLKVKQHKRA